jgi:hypothetical protein
LKVSGVGEFDFKGEVGGGDFGGRKFEVDAFSKNADPGGFVGGLGGRERGIRRSTEWFFGLAGF